LSKLKVGAGEQEMQTFATLNPGSTDFTKRAYLQASKILSQVGDECLNNLLSAAEGNDKQAYTEGSVDLKCGEYKFKIEAGGEFTVSTDKLNQSNKLFKGLLSTALNTAFTNPDLLQKDPGVKKMLGVIDQKSAKVSKVLISAESLPIIMQNEKKENSIKWIMAESAGAGAGASAGADDAKSIDEFLSKIRGEYWLIENIQKPLNAPSAYSLQELLDICKKLHIETHIKSESSEKLKDKTKKQLYEEILGQL
jgi:hypothetical protein